MHLNCILHVQARKKKELFTKVNKKEINENFANIFFDQ